MERGQVNNQIFGTSIIKRKLQDRDVGMTWFLVLGACIIANTNLYAKSLGHQADRLSMLQRINFGNRETHLNDMYPHINLSELHELHQ